MNFGNIVKNPAVVIGLVRALILVAVTLGLSLTEEQEAVIIGFVSLALTGITVFSTVGKAQVVEANKPLGLYVAKPKTRSKR